MLLQVPTEGPVSSGCPVLLASSATARTVTLRGLLQRAGCEVRTASALAEFEQGLVDGGSPTLVLSEASIRDADWRCLLRVTQRLREAPLFVLAAQSHDPLLWTELLNLGGYDLLPAPWSEDTVARLIHSAMRRWLRAREVARARELNAQRAASCLKQA
jgi:DNA-binding NtrC family response regulator